MTLLNLRARPVLALLLLAASWLLATRAAAEVPRADQAFLDARAPGVAALGTLADSVRTPEDALELIRRLLAQRRQDLGALQAKLPLTTLNGIETQDAYDLVAVETVHRLALAGMIADTSRVNPQEAQRFSDRMGTLPDMGKKPVPFMVLALAEIASAAADSASASGAMSRRSAARLADYLIGNATNQFYESRKEEVLAASAQNFRESSIVMRLRCPKDGAPYRVNTKQNRMDADMSVTTVFQLKCSECGELFEVEFPYELATKLNRMAEKQKLGANPQPARPNSVDP